jgi:hypothetical protein
MNYNKKKDILSFAKFYVKIGDLLNILELPNFSDNLLFHHLIHREGIFVLSYVIPC